MINRTIFYICEKSHIFQSLVPAAQMVLFIWLVVRAIMRGQWRSVIVESGALSVMTAETTMMLQWSVNSWYPREQVGWPIRNIGSCTNL